MRARLTAEEEYRHGTHAAILEVLAEARRADDAVVLAEALSLAHHCLLGPDHGQLRLRLAQEQVDVAQRTGRGGDLLVGLLWRTVDLFLAGDPSAAAHLAELRARLAARDHLAVGYVVRAIGVMLALRAGRLAEAEALAVECRERGAIVGDEDADGWYLGQLVAIRWYQGRVGELVDPLVAGAHSSNRSVVDRSGLAALAVAAAVAGDRNRAAGALARLAAPGLTAVPRSSAWLATMYGLVEAAHRLDDADLAAAGYRLLRPYAALPMVASLGVACFGSVRHALGVAALTTGDRAAAAEHFAAAVERNTALGHEPAAALSRQRLAQALVRSPGPGAAASRTDASASGVPARGTTLAGRSRRPRRLGGARRGHAPPGPPGGECRTGHSRDGSRSRRAGVPGTTAGGDTGIAPAAAGRAGAPPVRATDRAAAERARAVRPRRPRRAIAGRAGLAGRGARHRGRAGRAGADLRQ